MQKQNNNVQGKNAATGNLKRKAKKKKGRKGNNKGSSAPAGARQRVTTYALSTCSRDYLHVLVDPFWDCPRQVCVPDLIDSPSLKVRSISRGLFQVGDTGIGFVAVNPFRALANDLTSISVSLASYAISTLPTADASPAIGQAVGSFASVPFNNATFGVDPTANDVQGRTVALGIRARYVGTTLNASGTIIPVRLPDGRPVGGLSIAQLLTYPTCATFPASNRGWTSVTWYPARAADYDYFATPSTAVGIWQSTGTIALVVSGALDGNAYEFEIVAYQEFTGPKFGVSPSHSDASGLSTVRGFIESKNRQDMPSSSGIWNEAVKYVNSLTPEDVSGWVSGATTAVKLLEYL